MSTGADIVRIETLNLDLELEHLGQQMFDLVSELYPVCRSITGNGLRRTLVRLGELIPLNIHEVPSGTPVFDWTVPREWNIEDAYIKTLAGDRVVDFRKLNLHVLNYSIPLRARMSLAELKPHLFTLPNHPDWVPYRASYYQEAWGFCLSHRQLESLEEGEYEVCIDSSLRDGSLTYGECYLAGRIADEILISCHTCHPSLCNDNLSGVALTAHLARLLSSLSLRYSYRFLFIPGTIGAITWLSQNEEESKRVRHGLVVACVGDPGKIHYKKSRRGHAVIDRAVEHVLKHSGQPYECIEFSPYGSDERQYCSPGFNLAVGSLTRTPYGRFPEYHTSADNLEFVQSRYLADSLAKYLQVVGVLEKNESYLTANPKCEPQLGERGLYGALGGKTEARKYEMAMLWILNLSDGQHTLLDIAERSDLEFSLVDQTARGLVQHGLLKTCQL